MSGKSAFSEQEWKNIVAAAPMVGMAVSAASPNGPWGVIKEMFSVGMAMAELTREGSDNQLIQDLLNDLKARETRPERPPGMKNQQEVIDYALNHLRDVVRVIDVKASDDSDGFKSWLMQVGERVAEASNEGGIFGFGGVRVSDEERQMLSRISATLGATNQRA